MATFLFDDIVFGPIRSRRLGVSLGINLLPKDYKLCTFDCIYCECGFSEKGKSGKIPTVTEYKDSLQKKLEELKSEGITPDVFTFAGNGEPTIHPAFPEIVDFTILKRDEFFPNAKISVLSNSTMLHKQPVVDALKRVDNNILKLDSAIDETVKLMDAPNQKSFSVKNTIELLKQFGGNLIVQTMFLKGSVNGTEIDNTTDTEVEALIDALKAINPKQVMIYSIDRDTPVQTLQKIEKEEMEGIAEKIRKAGFYVSVA